METQDDDKEYEKLFDELITAFIRTGNKLQGTINVLNTKNLIYAEGLGRKILHHCLSVKYLSAGYALSILGDNYEPQVDFTSICILSRAALETYLTFNHIYVQPKDDDEHQFRFKCWDLAGYVERQKFNTATPETAAKQQEELLLCEALKSEIENCLPFKQAETWQQREAVKGNWRLGNSWSALAVNSGFSKSFFDDQYKFLCGHAHSGRLSIIQIQQVTSFKDQKKMTMASIGLLMAILAKYMFEYIQLIPELNERVDRKSKDYYLIEVWRQVGNGL